VNMNKLILAKGELGKLIQKYLSEQFCLRVITGEEKPDLLTEQDELLIGVVRSPYV